MWEQVMGHKYYFRFSKSYKIFSLTIGTVVRSWCQLYLLHCAQLSSEQHWHGGFGEQGTWFWELLFLQRGFMESHRWHCSVAVSLEIFHSLLGWKLFLLFLSDGWAAAASMWQYQTECFKGERWWISGCGCLMPLSIFATEWQLPMSGHVSWATWHVISTDVSGHESRTLWVAPCPGDGQQPGETGRSSRSWGVTVWMVGTWSTDTLLTSIRSWRQTLSMSRWSEPTGRDQDIETSFSMITIMFSDSFYLFISKYENKKCLPWCQTKQSKMQSEIYWVLVLQRIYLKVSFLVKRNNGGWKAMQLQSKLVPDFYW